ncbi:MATE family efflux transporter [Catenovulum sp. SM1970]|uniref:MATE family efflux transporter n=1 Tax=Marinifaba aquimaris TaxID=2741323 RepID=UPI001572C368|nr:MATE family efflux transporter [Marinifaba aquimaris]NTS78449.1 MATE family efflux transporter [Marinifaba aquimaris]
MSSVKKNPHHDLLNGPIESTLKSMTIPMVLGMIALMSFNLIDTLFIGFMGTVQLAAISFTFPITFTVISLAIGLGIGTSAVIAKTLGQGDKLLAKKHANSALTLSVIFVAVLCLIGYFTIDPLFRMLGATDEVLPYIKQYMEIWYMGCLFLVLPMVGNSVLRASGDTKTPSQVMAMGGLINAVLDPILIFGFGPIPALGMQGAALASLISWVIGTFAIVYILAYSRKLMFKRLPYIRELIQSGRDIMKIGLPAAGANMLTPIAMAILTAIVATYGKEAVAAIGVGNRIESIASMVVLALSMSLPPFVSQNYGAGQIDRIKQAYLSVSKFVMAWQFGTYVLLLFLAWPIARAFSSDEQVIDLITWFIWIMPLAYGLQGIVILTNSSLNALHKPMHALVLSVFRLFVFFLPLSYFGGLIADIHGLFVGGVIANLLMAILSFTWFSRQMKNCQLNQAPQEVPSKS